MNVLARFDYMGLSAFVKRNKVLIRRFNLKILSTRRLHLPCGHRLDDPDRLPHPLLRADHPTRNLRTVSKGAFLRLGQRRNSSSGCQFLGRNRSRSANGMNARASERPLAANDTTRFGIPPRRPAAACPRKRGFCWRTHADAVAFMLIPGFRRKSHETSEIRELSFRFAKPRTHNPR